jgi:hypothetical protein
MSVTVFDLAPEARINFTKMVFIYEEAQRVKLKLSEPNSLITVINSSMEKVNQDYMRYFSRFVQSLTSSELKELAKDGAQIYRGALVPPKSEAAHAVPVNQTVIYRGVRVEVEAAPVDGEQVQAKKGGGKRVYRGVILDD